MKKVDFWTEMKIFFKSLQFNQRVLKCPLRHFLGSQGRFTTGKNPYGHKGVKNADFKIRSF